MALPEDIAQLIIANCKPKTLIKCLDKLNYKVLGKGSSRKVYSVEHNGRPTALKVALDSRGKSQNKEELRTLMDAKAQELGVIIPIIDSSKHKRKVTWIQTEIAKPVSDKKFKSIVGVELSTFVNYLCNRDIGDPLPIEFKDTAHVRNLVEFFGHFPEIVVEDFEFLENWGLYNKKLVLIDLGFTQNNYDLY